MLMVLAYSHRVMQYCFAVIPSVSNGDLSKGEKVLIQIYKSLFPRCMVLEYVLWYALG